MEKYADPEKTATIREYVTVEGSIWQRKYTAAAQLILQTPRMMALRGSEDFFTRNINKFIEDKKIDGALFSDSKSGMTFALRYLDRFNANKTLVVYVEETQNRITENEAKNAAAELARILETIVRKDFPYIEEIKVSDVKLAAKLIPVKHH